MAQFDAWRPELEAALAEPFPDAWLQTKRQGGTQITFVGWHLYIHRLNQLVGPGWSMGEPILREVGGKLVMGLPVSIFGVTRVNFRSEEEEHGNADDDGKVRDFGSAETNSFAQALKRTLSLFGLRLSLYDKGGKMGARPAAPSQPVERVPPHQRKMPIGKHHKDVPLGDIPSDALRSTITWCEEKGKFADLVADCRFVLASRTSPDPGDDLPPLPF